MCVSILRKLAVTAVAVLSAAFFMSAGANGLYFDGGIGVGWAWTELGGTDASDMLAADGVTEIGVDFGLKVGYGPLASLPLYAVGVFGGVGHRFDDGDDYIQFNSYMIGPGAVYYPLPFLQVAGSIGLFIRCQPNVISDANV